MVLFPLADSIGGLLCHCSGVSGYSAGVGNNLIPGWPFLVAYQLMPCPLKSVRTPVAIFGSLGVCIYGPASRHWLISHSPIHLT